MGDRSVGDNPVGMVTPWEPPPPPPGSTTVELYTVVHPLDPDHHPDGTAGWYRWAVHTGRDWVGTASCVNAHLEPTRAEAAVSGERVAYAIAAVLDRLGVPNLLSTVHLATDPLED